mmetsp:Transcript_61752/g.72161  ORF Transcript_61752/g.72161 Transcript_61752/m.72161 type:complete len:80 (+) Transcript_61752:531-770(+)
MLVRTSGHEPDAIGFQRVNGEIVKIGTGGWKCLADFELGERFRELILGEWSHDGEEELEIVGQEIGIHGTEFAGYQFMG